MNSNSIPVVSFSIESNGEQISGGTDVGIHVVSFNATSGQPISIQSFDPGLSGVHAEEFETFIKDIPLGSIVAIATCGSVVGELASATAGSTIRHLSDKTRKICTTVGSYLIHSLDSADKAWSLIGVKGAAPAAAFEQLEPQHSEVSVTFPLQTKKIDDVSILAKSAGLNAGDAVEFVVDGKKVDLGSGNLRGLNVIVIDEDSFAVLENRVFDTFYYAAGSFVEFMDSLPVGRIVAIAVKDEATRNLSDAAKEACKSIGSDRIEELGYRQSWAIVGYKGASAGSVAEVLNNDDNPVQCLSLVPKHPLTVDGISAVACSGGYLGDSTEFGKSAFVTLDGVKPDHDITRGITLAVVEPSSGTFEKCKTFDTFNSTSESDKLVGFINGIQAGKMVLGIISDEAKRRLETNARRALEQIGSSRIWDVEYRNSWAIVGRKGCAPGSAPELQIGAGVVAVQLTIRFDSPTFARPYYCLRADSAGFNHGNYATISVDHNPILSDENGMTVVVFNGKNYAVEASGGFNTYSSTAESDRLVSFINQQENGSVIAMAVKDEASKRLTDEAKEVIASLGSTEIHNLGWRNSWSMIAVKGYAGQVVETISSESPARCTFCLPCGGISPLADPVANINQVLLKASSYAGSLFEQSTASKTDQNGSSQLGYTSQPGMVAICIDPSSSEVITTAGYITGRNVDRFAEFIEDSIPTGAVAVIFGRGDIVTGLSDRAKRAIESLGSGHIRSITANDCWALIGVKGAAPGSVCETMPGSVKESVSMLLQEIPHLSTPTSSSTVHRQKRAAFLLAGLIASTVVELVVGTYYTSTYKQPLPAVYTPTIHPVCKPGKRRALVVGITYAKHQSRFLLGKPTMYARRIKSALANTKSITLQDITLLTDEPEPQDLKGWPSRANIEATLKEFSSNAADNDVYLFYYCGHGGTNITTLPVDIDNPARQEYLITLSENGSRKDLLYDTRLNEVTSSFPNNCNLTFIFDACHSGGMFDGTPALAHPMKGIAITSVDATIPSIIENNPEPVTLSSITTEAIRKSKKSTPPSYRELFNKVHTKTTVEQRRITLPDGSRITSRYEPQIFYNHSLIDANAARFLEPFPWT